MQNVERDEQQELEEIVRLLDEGPTDNERRGAQARALEPGLDRAALQDLLIREIEVDRGEMNALARSWLLDTLARVAHGDADATKVLLRHLDAEHESEPWVRYWTLAGMWVARRTGRTPDGFDSVVDVVAKTDPEPLVRLLARALQASRGDEKSIVLLQQALGNPELQFPALRALRIEPLPELLEEVAALRGKSNDEVIEWNVGKVLASMGREAGPQRDLDAGPETIREPVSDEDPDDLTTVRVGPPPPPFAGEILGLLTEPSLVPAGTPFMVWIRVRNTGKATWERLDRFRVGISVWKWNAEDPLAENQHVNTLERDVPPLDDLEISIRLDASDEPGRYVIRAHVYGDERWGSDSFVGEDRTELEVSENPETPLQSVEAELKEDPWDEVRELERTGLSSSPDLEEAAEAPVLETAQAGEPSAREAPAPSPAQRPPGAADAVGVPDGELYGPTPVPPPPVRPPAPAAPPPIQHHTTIVIPRYEPPPEEGRLVLTLTAESAAVEYDGTKYVSPLRLDEAELLALGADPDGYGRALFRAAFNTGRHRLPAESTDHGYRVAMEQTGGDLRFEVEVQDPDLGRFAWELLHDGEAGPPIATRERTPFYRRVGSRDAEMVDPPLRVLVAISSPQALGKEGNRFLKELQPLQVAREAAAFEEDLERLAEGGLVEYEVVGGDPATPLTLETLTAKLQEGFHVLHFLGHGLYDGRKRYCLALEREGGESPLVTGDDFAQALLAVRSELRLVVLASCQSGRIAPDAETGPALGTVLVQAGLPAVVSMREDLGVETARYLNQRFYSHLARSEHVEMALAATRFDIYQRKIDGESAWSVPVLHLGVKAGRLFGVDRRRAAQVEDVEPEIAPATPPPGAQPASRVAQEVAEAVRRAGADGGPLGEQRIAGMVEEAMRAAPEGAPPLARPQNRAALTRAMPGLVRLRWADLAAFVTRQTGLRMPDAVYAQAASALNAGKHVVFIGPPGTGKTSLAHAVAEHARAAGFSTGTVPTTASADWTTFDTVGGYVPVSAGRLDFRPGIFLRAIAEGRWLVLDEINRAEIDKAVGELFTVLSGQQVDLPYRVQERQVRVLPPRGAPHPADWVPDEATGPYDYVIHPNWRILATMNVYDKSSLFGMSFAFMRRFAFVDVGIPDEAATFGPLRREWVARSRPAVAAAHGGDDARAQEKLDGLVAKLDEVFRPGEGTLMGRRALGPAIAGDMIRYVFDRFSHEPRADQADLVALAREAFLLYAVPQLDGLDRQSVLEVYGHVARIFYGGDGGGGAARPEILRRIEDLYPHIRGAEWQAAAAPGAARGDDGDG